MGRHCCFGVCEKARRKMGHHFAITKPINALINETLVLLIGKPIGYLDDLQSYKLASLRSSSINQVNMRNIIVKLGGNR